MTHTTANTQRWHDAICDHDGAKWHRYGGAIRDCETCLKDAVCAYAAEHGESIGDALGAVLDEIEADTNTDIDIAFEDALATWAWGR